MNLSQVPHSPFSNLKDQLTLKGYKERFHWLDDEQYQWLCDDPHAFLRQRFPKLIALSSSWTLRTQQCPNPSCGETTTVTCCENKEVSQRIWFYSGDQCALALASGSLLMKLLDSRSLQQHSELLEQLIKRYARGSRAFSQELQIPQDDDVREYMSFLQGIQDFPVRARCFLINLEAAYKCLHHSSQDLDRSCC